LFRSHGLFVFHTVVTATSPPGMVQRVMQVHGMRLTLPQASRILSRISCLCLFFHAALGISSHDGYALQDPNARADTVSMLDGGVPSPLVLGESATRREFVNETMLKAKQAIDDEIANNTKYKDLPKALLIEENAKKAEAAKQLLLEGESKIAAEKLSKPAKVKLSMVEKVARAKLEERNLHMKAMTALKRATTSGNNDDLEEYEATSSAADEQGIYLKGLQRKAREIEEDARVLRDGKHARAEVEDAKIQHTSALKETRRALQLTIQSGTDTDLQSYLGLRRKAEHFAATMEDARHKVDAAVLVEEKVADREEAAAFKDAKSKNPRVAMLVWEELADHARVAYKNTKRKADKMTKDAERSGNFAMAKKARDKMRKARLKYAEDSLKVSSFKVKTAHKFALRVMDDEKTAVRRLRKDKSQANILRDRMKSAETLQREATDTLNIHVIKEKTARKKLSIAKTMLEDITHRSEELRRHRRDAVENFDRSRRAMMLTKQEIHNTLADMEERQETRSEIQTKKMLAVQTKIRHAKAELYSLKKQQEIWETTGVPAEEGGSQKPPNQDAESKVVAASEKVIKKLKMEQDEELKSIKMKIETLRKGAMGVAEQAGKAKETKMDMETQEMDERQQAAEEETVAVADKMKQKTMQKDEELRDTMKRRMERRMERIKTRANKKLLEYDTLLKSGAKGAARERLLAKIQKVKDRRDERTVQLQRKIKRRLKRRLKRNEVQGQRKEKAAVAGKKLALDQVEKQRLLNITLSDAEKAMSKVDDVKKKIIKQEFGILAQKRRDIVEVTRNKVAELQRSVEMAKDEVSRHRIKDSIEILRKEADTKIVDLTKKNKGRGTT